MSTKNYYLKYLKTKEQVEKIDRNTPIDLIKKFPEKSIAIAIN
jgi:hypothetical protein